MRTLVPRNRSTRWAIASAFILLLSVLWVWGAPPNAREGEGASRVASPVFAELPTWITRREAARLFPVSAYPAVGQSLKITRMASDANADAVREIHVDIQNLGGTPADGAAWFILSTERAQPWLHSVYTSDRQPIEALAPNQTTTLMFASPPGISSTFFISVVVEQVRSGVRAQSDVAVSLEPLPLRDFHDREPFTTVLPGLDQHLDLAVPTVMDTDERHALPLRLARIATTPSATGSAFVRATIINLDTTPRSGAVWFTLAPPDSAQPWEDAVYTSPAVPVEPLAAGARRDFDLPLRLSEVPRGELALSVWAHARGDDGALAHSDGARLPDLLDQRDPFLRDYTVEYTDAGVTVSALIRAPRAAGFLAAQLVLESVDAPAIRAEALSTLCPGSIPARDDETNLRLQDSWQNLDPGRYRALVVLVETDERQQHCQVRMIRSLPTLIRVD